MKATLFLLAVLACAPAQAQLYVDADATGANTGASWADAFTDLQDALAVAGAGDEIWIAEGVYKPTATDDRSVSFVLSDGVALYGGFDGTETMRDERDWRLHQSILSGEIGDLQNINDNSYHVMEAVGVGAGTLVDGLMIERGRANAPDPEDRGAGLYAPGSSLVVRNMTFHQNQASGSGLAMLGGGMYVSNGDPLLEECLFTENIGFGALHVSGGTATVRRVHFDQNIGGGLAFYKGATGAVEDSVIENGSESSGMYVTGSSPSFRRVTFRGNHISTDGGAARIVDQSSALFEDCLFEHNYADGFGGAVFVRGLSEATFLRSTFRRNVADNVAGAVFAESSQLHVIGSRFETNRGSAGIVHFDESTGSVVGSVFAANRTTSDGGWGAVGVNFAPPPGEPPVVIANSLFVGNYGARGGAIYLNSSGAVRVVNVTATANRAERGGAMHTLGGEQAEVTNSIFFGNASDDGLEIAINAADDFGPAVAHSLVEGGYGLGPSTAVLDADPLFIRAPDPGPDGQWTTGDDDYGDLRLVEGSPAVDYGLAQYLPADVWDLDGDGDTSEPLPLDIQGGPRVLGESVDLGAYEGALQVASEPDAPEILAERMALSAYPNPSRGVARVTLTLPASGAVRVAVYDVLGREVAVLADRRFEAGAHSLTLDGSKLASGTYLVRASMAGTPAQVQRVTVLR